MLVGAELILALLVRGLSRGGPGARLGLHISSFGVTVRHDGLVHASLHLSVSVPMVQLLSDPLINFDEFDQFLV